MKRSTFKMRSGNSTSFKMMGSTSPVKHGKFEDFQYGKKGHNPDTMSAKHEDFHAKQSGKSPIEKKVDLTKKTGLGPRATVDPMSVNEQAYEMAQNMFDVDNPTKQQIGAAMNKMEKEYPEKF